MFKCNGMSSTTRSVYGSDILLYVFVSSIMNISWPSSKFLGIKKSTFVHCFIPSVFD